MTPTGHPDESTADTTPDIDLDTVFDLLSCKRRCHVVDLLAATGTADQPLALETTVQTIAARENDVLVAEVDTTQRKRVYVSLKQNHLDKLNTVEVIQYDSRSNTLAPGQTFAPVATILNVGKRLFGPLDGGDDDIKMITTESATAQTVLGPDPEAFAQWEQECTDGGAR